MRELLLKLTCRLHQCSLDLWSWTARWRWLEPFTARISDECLRLRFTIKNYGRSKEDRHPTLKR